MVLRKALRSWDVFGTGHSLDVPNLSDRTPLVKIIDKIFAKHSRTLDNSAFPPRYYSPGEERRIP
jgi:hypothetical protein